MYYIILLYNKYMVISFKVLTLEYYNALNDHYDENPKAFYRQAEVYENVVW